MLDCSKLLVAVLCLPLWLLPLLLQSNSHCFSIPCQTRLTQSLISKPPHQQQISPALPKFTSNFQCKNTRVKPEPLPTVLYPYNAAKPCACPKILKPLCCKGDKQFDNKCQAKCAGAKKCKKGKCSKCVCPKKKNKKPVCCGGKTYKNKCVAKCKGAKKCTKGLCKPCICPKILKPVCCKNG